MAFSNEIICAGTEPFKVGESLSKFYNLWASNSLYGDFSLHALAEQDATVTVEISNHPEILGWVPSAVIPLVAGEVYLERIDLKPCKFVRFTITNTSNVENKIKAVACFI